MCQGNKHKFLLVFHWICGFEDMAAATSVMGYRGDVTDTCTILIRKRKVAFNREESF
jgi:hypothetical protein